MSKLPRSLGMVVLAALVLGVSRVQGQENTRLEIGEVLFTSAANGNLDIVAMKPDGTGLRSLTDSPADDSSPIWSPDGRAILFLSDRDGSGNVFIMNTDGSEQRNITQSELAEFSADWSPDAAQIVFARADSTLQPAEGGTAQLFIRDLATGEETQLTDDPAFNNEPAWDPQGEYIAYVSDIEGTPQIYLLRLSDGETIRISGDANASRFNPAWSPNGEWLAYDSVVEGNRDIYVMRRNGERILRLTDHPDTDMQPVWTFDGLRLMFSSDRTGTMQIYRMDASGRGVVRLTDSPTTATQATCLWADPNSGS
jgi:TolB protein